MDWHPIQGGVAILLVTSCYGDRDKLRPDGPLGSYTDFTFTFIQLGRRGGLMVNALDSISNGPGSNPYP